MAADPVLRPLYPEEDLGPAEVRLRMFLEQYWGGPRTYSEQRGHPRLRMRHAPFVIGLRERDHWLAAMKIAVDGAGLDDGSTGAAVGLPGDGRRQPGQLAALITRMPTSSRRGAPRIVAPRMIP